MKLDILLVTVAVFLGISIGMMVAHAVAVISLPESLLTILWGGLTTILGTGLGAAIAVHGAMKAAIIQVDRQREHGIADRKTAGRERHRTTVLHWLVPYKELRNFAWTPLTSESGPLLFMRSNQLLAIMRSLLAAEIALKPGDLGYMMWPYCVSALQRLIDQHTAATAVDNFDLQQFHTARIQEAAEDACHALYSLLVFCFGHGEMGTDPWEMIPTMQRPRPDIPPMPASEG